LHKALHCCHHSAEEQEENKGREFSAPTGVAPSAAVQIPWGPVVPHRDADVQGAQQTATVMHSNNRQATSSHDQEEHPYIELLHLLHALRYLVSGSAG
jgi:hypothetical protein